jgi:K+-transporting ATPase A subunit
MVPGGAGAGVADVFMFMFMFMFIGAPFIGDGFCGSCTALKLGEP